MHAVGPGLGSGPRASQGVLEKDIGMDGCRHVWMQMYLSIS